MQILQKTGRLSLTLLWCSTLLNYTDAGTRKGADPHYDVMALADIKADIKAPPGGHLARRDAILLLWSTGRDAAAGPRRARDIEQVPERTAFPRDEARVFWRHAASAQAAEQPTAVARDRRFRSAANPAELHHLAFSPESRQPSCARRPSLASALFQ